jgi:ketosteroid isomerase-like protein
MGSPQTALDQVRLAMLKTNGLFNLEVFGKRNFDALDSVYTKDARIMPPGAPMVSGRDEIKKWWAALIESINAKSAVLESIDVMTAGDDVVEIGRAILSAEPDIRMEAKYVVYWRQEDGHWKWHVDIWNMNA